VNDPRSHDPEAEPPPSPYDDASTVVDGHFSSPDRAAARPMPVVEGYELIRELGRGGMGVVYEARQKTLNRKVALKMVLASEHAADRTLARFLAEAEIAAGLQHTHIVHIHELGQAMGLPYIAMEFVDGCSMAGRMRAFGDDFRGIAGFFEKLARGTQWAHQNAVIHRDLKPANVLISREGEPKIADFGLAKRLGDSTQHPALTLSGEQMGTPAYMAPEQAFPDMGAIGPATDIYSLGVMLYEALAGKVPISAGSHAEMLTLLRNDDPPPPSTSHQGLPRDLETICMKCLRKEPRERYASAGAFADDLRRFITGEPILAKPPSPLTLTFRWVRRHRFAAASLLTILLAAGAGLGVWAHFTSKQSEREAQEKLQREQYEDLHVREFTQTFANFTRRHGQYIGFGQPLTPEQLAHRSFSYQIVREGRAGRCLRMAYVNSSGKPFWYWATPDVLVPGLLEGVPRHRLPCIFELRYTADNRVSEERLLDATGRLAARLRYTYPEGYDPAKAQTDFIQADFVDDSSRPLETPSGLSSLQFQRDSAGQEQRILYCDTRGTPRVDKDGAGGMEVRYDAQGGVAAVVMLNPKGEPAPNNQGRAVMKLTWDDRHVLTARAFFDLNEKPVAVEGAHLTRIENDPWGNPLVIQFFGTDGKTPARSFASGAAGTTGFRWTLNDSGLPLTFTSSGYDSARTGYASLVTRNEWAADTALHTVTSCLDTDGKPTRGGGGWQSIEEWIDSSGRSQRTIRDGCDAKPPRRTREIETTEWSPQGDKLRSTVKYQDPSGQPAMDFAASASELVKEYDPAERVTKSTYLIHPASRLPYERMVVENEWKKEAPTDTRRFPGLSTENAGPDTESSAGTAAGSSRTAVNRIQAALKSQNVKMVRKSAHYLNAAGQPAPSAKGNTGWVREFDEKGYALTETHTGFHPQEYPYARIVITTAWKPGYQGHTDTWRYYNREGKAVRSKDGYTQYAQESDEKDHVLSETKSGFDESRTLYATERIDYSGYHGDLYRRRAYAYFDASGRRIRYQGDYMDYVEDYDEKGDPVRIESSGYNPDRFPWFRQTTRLESSPDGKTLTYIKSWQDAAGSPLRGKHGELESRDLFTTADNLRLSTIASGFDEKDRGFSTRTLQYSDTGAITSLTYADSQGRPVTNLRPYITAIDPGSPAASLHLQPGDLILTYNNRPPANSLDFANPAHLPGGTLEILRRGKQIKLPNIPPGKLGITLEDRAYSP
jgi:serine/threonine protein kinase